MLAKLFSTKNIRKGFSTITSKSNLSLLRQYQFNCLFTLQRNSFSINNFDLLDKEINEVKKVNSEFKTPKTLIKKRLNKEKYINNTPRVNTEEISNKINEVKNNNNFSNENNRRLNRFNKNKENFMEEKNEKIPENFQSFFDDSAFDKDKSKDNSSKSFKNDEKINIKNNKEKEAGLDNSANASRIKLEQFGENVDLDEIEKHILNKGTAKSAYKEKKFRDILSEKGKDSVKPYKNFGGGADYKNKFNSKFQSEEKEDEAFNGKKEYSNLLKYSKMKDEKFMTEEEKANKKINHLLDNLYNFNSDFIQIKPLETKIIHENEIEAEENDDLESAEDPKAKKAVENIRKILQTKRIREKGAAYIINVIFSIYRSLIPKEEKASNLSKENIAEKKDNKQYQEELYFKKIQSKLDDSKQKLINEVFAQNEIIEGINNIVSHINTLKGDDMEKLINIICKINYFNFEKWKKILEEYLLHLSMYSDTSYQLYSPKELGQIIVHLKTLEDSLLLGKDNFSVSKDANLNSNLSKEDILNLIKTAFDKSSDCFLKDLEFKKVEFFSINTYMVVMARYKLLDEKISKKIENAILPILDTLEDTDLCNLMFNVFKNKFASEKFFSKLEKKAEALLSDYLAEKKPVDAYLVMLIAKSILSGMRNNHTLLLLLEELYLKYKNAFAVHQTITVAYTLVSLDSANLSFIKEIDSFLSAYDKKANLTELLCYQVVTIIVKNSDFSEANLVEYLNVYKKFIDKNQVKPRQLKYLANELKNRLKNFSSKPVKEGAFDTRKFLDEYYKEISAKNNLFKYKK